MKGSVIMAKNHMAEPPTHAQLEYIKSIEEFVDVQFDGKTKEDARKYISKHVDEFKLKSMDNWALEKGYF